MRTLSSVVLVLASAIRPAPGLAQSQPTQRALYDQVVHSMVQIRTGGAVGSGWLLAQSERPVVITNRHVVVRDRPIEVLFYQGTDEEPVSVRADVWKRSRTIDLAVLRLRDDPPSSARAVQLRSNITVYRGEPVALGGNPRVPTGILNFQTTGGVVTGHVSGSDYSRCGVGRNCIVIDAASLGGSSGGPAFNRAGELVGMLWGGPRSVSSVATTRAVGVAVGQNPSFSYLIHVRTIMAELRRMGG